MFMAFLICSSTFASEAKNIYFERLRSNDPTNEEIESSVIRISKFCKLPYVKKSFDPKDLPFVFFLTKQGLSCVMSVQSIKNLLEDDSDSSNIEVLTCLDDTGLRSSYVVNSKSCKRD